MLPLYFTDSRRRAAYEILRGTTLGEVLGSHVEDDGRALVVRADTGDWGRLSSGERVLLDNLEAIATTTPMPIAAAADWLDEGCKRALLAAVGQLFHMDVAAEAKAA